MSMLLMLALCVIIKLIIEIKRHKAGKAGTKNSTSYAGGEEENDEKQRHPKSYTLAETGSLLYVVELPWHVCCT
jgi:hypothetical protein